MVRVEETGDGISFTVSVVPRASRSEIVGERNGALRVRIAAPPVDGAANAELIRALAKAFGVAKTSVTIVSGKASKSKRVCVDGITRRSLEILTQRSAS